MTLSDIKQLSIRDFLAACGVTPKSERQSFGMYLSPFREEATPSFKVDYAQNLWYDFGIGEGGSIIDLVARLKRCSVAEAIDRLKKTAIFLSTPTHRSHPNLQSQFCLKSHLPTHVYWATSESEPLTTILPSTTAERYDTPSVAKIISP